MVKRSRWFMVAACVAISTLAVYPRNGAADSVASGKESKPAKVEPANAAKTAKPDASSPGSTGEGEADNLQASQQQVASEYKDLQGVLMRMRDLIRPSDPNRAALIEKALKESGDRRVDADLQEIVDLIRQEQLGSAARKQGKVHEDMEAILQMLQSEERSKVLQGEKDAIRKYLARVQELIVQQMDLQGRNLGGDDPKPLSAEQEALAKQTGKLADDVRKNEEKNRGSAKGDSKGDPKNGDSKNKGDSKNDGKSADGKSPAKPDGKETAKPDGKEKGKGKPDGKEPGKSDGKDPKSDKEVAKSDAKSDGKAKADEGEKSQGKGQPSESQSQSQGKPSKSQPGKGQSQSDPRQQDQDQNSDQSQQAQDQNAPPPEENPVRKRLQMAKENMEKAQEQLDKAKREGAAEAQQKAIDDLNTAKAELEAILKQLREEEMKRLLAMLEARMQKVLMIQKDINDSTVRLDKVPVAERSHGHEIESGRLSTKQDGNVQDVKQALSLLREEGSAVAMPEALEQVRDDMQQIVIRLAQGKTEVLTQAIETDVLKELQEIVDALKKAQKDIGKNKPPKNNAEGEPQDPPLIEMLSELKMIRALQNRVNSRTERYAKLIKGQQTEDADVFEALRRLSEQQKRVHKVTRDLEMGKNE